MSAIGQLSKSLGYEFKDITLLEAALTHRSASAAHNERLEFLGDSILGFVIAEALYRRYPDEDEGELSRMRARLVNRETLSEIAKEFDLGPALVLGPGELKSGGVQRESILAGAMEAVTAAIYFDADLRICKERLLAWFNSRLEDESFFAYQKDAKTKLQEYLQAEGRPLPHYRILDITGKDHQQVFFVECVVDGLDPIGQGKGANRRKAEQAAALDFLKKVDEE